MMVLQGRKCVSTVCDAQILHRPEVTTTRMPVIRVLPQTKTPEPGSAVLLPIDLYIATCMAALATRSDHGELSYPEYC